MNQEFNKKLTEILTENNLPPKFVLGLSGGPDSISMLHLMRDFIKINSGSKLIPIIVDHGIRKNSKYEAIQVKQISEKLGFNAFIKTINETPPKSNLQNWARQSRRTILVNEALKNDCVLLLAHHFDDQIETLFMRLIKGSGFLGLIGMRYIKNWNGIIIIRPFINLRKQKLLNFLNKNKFNYMTDPSNNDLKFERVQTRELLIKMEEDISFPISKYLNKLSILSHKILTLLDDRLMFWLIDNVKFYKHGSISANFDEFYKIYKISPNLCNLIFGKLIQKVGGNNFPPKKNKIFEKLNLFFFRKIQKFTLGNVIIFLKFNKIVLIREIRNLLINHYVSSRFPLVFDQRFVIYSKYDGNVLSSSNFKTQIINLNNSNLFSSNSNYINKTLPILKTLEGRVIRPYLSTIDKKEIYKQMTLNHDFNLFFIRDLGLR